MPVAIYNQDSGDGDGAKCHVHLRQLQPAHDYGSQGKTRHASDEMELPSFGRL